MNPRLNAGLKALASAVVLAASAGAGGADVGIGEAGRVSAVSFAVDKAQDTARLGKAGEGSNGAETHIARQKISDKLSAFAYDASALADEPFEGEAVFGRYAVRLYPIGGGGLRGSGTAKPVLQPGRAGSPKSIAQSTRDAEKTSLPEPGNWAMVLAGLLGVGAMARRRMSA